MAELCARQGLLDQAIDIFRRLAEIVEDPDRRLRYQTRISELARDPSLRPIETPGLRVREVEGEIQIEWRLPPELPNPTLQVLFLKRGAGGIEPDGRTVPLAAAHGHMTFPADGVASVRAAAGRLYEGSFIPVVRHPERLG